MGKTVKLKQLNLGSYLTIDKIKSIYTRIEKELLNNKEFEIVSDDIKGIDLTGIQMLHSIINRAQHLGIKIQFNLSISNEQRIMLQKNGFSQILETVFR
jgi:hypothetical protein